MKKLLNCTSCHDILSLTKFLRSCQCGSAKGLYIKNGFQAAVTANGHTRMLEMVNAEYLKSVNDPFISFLNRYNWSPITKDLSNHVVPVDTDAKKWSSIEAIDKIIYIDSETDGFARSSDDEKLWHVLKKKTLVLNNVSVTQGQMYQHYRNKQLYKVLHIGICEKQMFVIYEAQYNDETFGDNCVWARRLEEFTEIVGGGKARFTLVDL